MKKIDEFTDLELDQQIETLSGMDVMGSKKLLNSFIEEKERRAELRKKEIELKQKQAAEEEKKQLDAKQEIGKAFSDIYGKCYKVTKGGDGIIQYYHVRGLIDDIVIADIVYKQEGTNGHMYHLSSETYKYITFDTFKNITKKENEITLTEFNAVQKNYSPNDCFYDLFKPHFYFTGGGPSF